MQKGSLGNDLQGSPTEGAIAHHPVGESLRVLSSLDSDEINQQQCSEGLERETGGKQVPTAGSEARRTLVCLVAVRKEVETGHGNYLSDRP